MANAQSVSPYTIGPPVDGVTPGQELSLDPAYAVPGPDAADSDGWWDATGFATSLRLSPTGTPDATRLGQLPVYETREGAGDPEAFAHTYRDEINTRHRVEDQDADGFETQVQFARYAPRPEPTRDGEAGIRPTGRMSPLTYVFTRPFGRGTARFMNGEHFSMADHRRDYPIHGMSSPRKVGRNTFRLEPEPWDTDNVQLPPSTDGSPDLRIRAVDIPPADNRSWRL